MVNKFTNINKTSNHHSSNYIEHTKEYDIAFEIQFWLSTCSQICLHHNWILVLAVILFGLFGVELNLCRVFCSLFLFSFLYTLLVRTRICFTKRGGFGSWNSVIPSLFILLSYQAKKVSGHIMYICVSGVPILPPFLWFFIWFLDCFECGDSVFYFICFHYSDYIINPYWLHTTH